MTTNELPARPNPAHLKRLAASDSWAAMRSALINVARYLEADRERQAGEAVAEVIGANSGGRDVQTIAVRSPLPKGTPLFASFPFSQAAQADRLYDQIKEVLEHHRLTHTMEDEDSGFRLVDMLCPPGSKDIAPGKDEIVFICDAIFNEVLCKTLDAPSPDGKAEQAEAPSDVVAFEFFNPATGHAIVDYTVNTHVGRLGKEQGYEARPLGYVNPPPAAVKIGDPVPLWQAREALDSLEESARGDAPYNHFAANIIRTALEQAATQPTASNAGERGGWKEAVIAWEVCASIHREWAKGKDALFTTRQADFVKHAADARAALASKPPAGEQKPVAHVDLSTFAWGVTRMGDNPKAVLVSFRSEPTDDDLRALHEALRPSSGRTVHADSAQPEQVAQDREDAVLKQAEEALDISQALLESARSYHHPKVLAAYNAIRAARARGEGKSS